MRDTLRSPIVREKLERIAERARAYPQSALTTLCHHIDVAMLTEAFYALRRDSAAGIDRVTWRQYREGVEANLSDLHRRLKGGAYRAQPSRRVWIDKENGGKRPIAVTVLEDKVVERAEVMLLEAVYDQDFYGFSFGFRRGKSQHQAVKYFRDNCMVGNGCWVIDVDLKGYLEPCSYCTPVHERWSKRLGLSSMIFIFNPLRLPFLTWIAESSPRFTRCKTVCRETPNFLVASCIVT